MENTMLVMDDDMDNVLPLNNTDNQAASPSVHPAEDGGTRIDPAVPNKPKEAPSFTDVIKDVKAATPAVSAASSQPVTPVQSATPAKSVEGKPKMSRKKKIIIATAGLAGVAGITAAAAAILRKGTEEVADNLAGTGEGLFNGLSGTAIPGDSLSFSEAFANARQGLGPNGVFKWRGQLYGTMLKEEWDGLSHEGQQQFSDEAQSVALDNDFQNEDDSAEAISVMDEVDSYGEAEEGEPAEYYDEVEEGEPAEYYDEVEEGEPAEYYDEVEEGEPAEYYDEVEEGEPAEYYDEVEEDESADDVEFEEDDEVNDGDYLSDYMNDEDLSDFI